MLATSSFSYSHNVFSPFKDKKNPQKQESACKKGHAPLTLLCHSHCDLDLYLIDPKIDTEHLLSVTNVCMKFEKARPKQTLVIDRTRLYTINGWTKPWTDRCKAIYPHLFQEGIINCYL